jgi:putative Mg2+ transporter-C (MgtC) family protein
MFFINNVYDELGLLDVFCRLIVAVLLGGLVGVERQLNGHWVGLRTLMAVSMGAAIFTLVGKLAAEQALQGGANAANTVDVTRVIQGIAAGVGFLGAGAILKLSDQLEIKGLTTASAIWLSAALGTAAGLALWELALAATVVSLVVLALLRPVEKWLAQYSKVEKGRVSTVREQAVGVGDPSPVSAGSVSKVPRQDLEAGDCDSSKG